MKPTKPHVGQHTGYEGWFTPVEILEAARRVMGSIDCDPASCEEANKNVNAARFFTKEQDGLRQKWEGNVWLNPPYKTTLMERFALKLIYQFRDLARVEQAIVLTNNATETHWFRMLACNAKFICLPKGRLKFSRADGSGDSPLQGQALLFYGTRFPKEFQQFGRVWR